MGQHAWFPQSWWLPSHLVYLTGKIKLPFFLGLVLNKMHSDTSFAVLIVTKQRKSISAAKQHRSLKKSHRKTKSDTVPHSRTAITEATLGRANTESKHQHLLTRKAHLAKVLWSSNKFLRKYPGRIKLPVASILYLALRERSSIHSLWLVLK